VASPFAGTMKDGTPLRGKFRPIRRSGPLWLQGAGICSHCLSSPSSLSPKSMRMSSTFIATFVRWSSQFSASKKSPRLSNSWRNRAGIVRKSKTASINRRIKWCGRLNTRPPSARDYQRRLPSGAATYSQTRAQFGYAMYWVILFCFPLMAAIQEI